MGEGEALRAICRTPGFPAASTVRMWVVDNVDGLAERYARAREAQAHALADDLLALADDGQNDWMADNDPDNPGYKLNGEHVQRSRLRYDARKWLASKILPKVYGEKLDLNHSGTIGTLAMPIDPSKLNEDQREAFQDILLSAAVVQGDEREE